MLLCGRFFCRMRRERLSKRKRPARGWPLNAGEERLLQTGSIAQQLRFVGFFPREMFATKVTVCCGFFVDRVQQIQHLNQTVWTQVKELTYQQSQLFRRHFLSTESFYHDGGRFSHADCVGNLNFTTIGQASSNDVFRDITCCVGCGTVHF